MLDAGFARVREKIFPVDGALADIGQAAPDFHRGAGGALVGVRGWGVLVPDFYLNGGEVAGDVVKVGDGFRAFAAHPPELHPHAHNLVTLLADIEVSRQFSPPP